jgi:hypothetical protein
MKNFPTQRQYARSDEYGGKKLFFLYLDKWTEWEAKMEKSGSFM